MTRYLLYWLDQSIHSFQNIFNMPRIPSNGLQLRAKYVVELFHNLKLMTNIIIIIIIIIIISLTRTTSR